MFNFKPKEEKFYKMFLEIAQNTINKCKQIANIAEGVVIKNA